MDNYRFTALFTILLVFFGTGVIDKIAAQTEWGGLDILVTFIVSVLSGAVLYMYKNKH